MKKFFFPALAALFIVGMTSCKKDWTCRCTINSAGQTSEVVTTISNASKSDAEASCTASATTLGGSVNCALD